MLHAEFVHLHVHTNYSLLDGACRVTPLIKKAAEMKFPALAITDHGNLFGAVEFYETCQKHGVKPIIGCEAYIAPNSRFDKTGTGIRDSNAHLVLLAKDEDGYANLMRLVSISYLEGFYYKPRIDKEVLAKHSAGLILLTSCLKGILNVHLTQEQTELARKTLEEFAQIMGRENVYVELQNHGMALEDKTRPVLRQLAKDAGVKCVATNDVHYIEQAHAQAHDALMAIQTQTTIDDPHRLRYEKPEFFLKSAEQMQALFPDDLDAVKTSLEIADRCNVELSLGKIHLPYYEPPAGKTHQDYLRELCGAGLKGRYGEADAALTQRLEHELGVIQQAGYTSYFLIVWDFVRFAKEQGIPVGPGRGSAAGSLVSYCLGITDIDPIRYDLLFERFLNPQRVTQPDIDIDFCYERRPEVIEYVIQKYGKTNVAQIITFGTMQAKAVVRDVARVMKLSYAEADRLAKLIPNELDITLAKAMHDVPELAQLYKTNEQIKQLIDTAQVLEGLTRHASTHAAGVVIADKPLSEYVPLFKSNDGSITTGTDMTSLEHIGLLKIDMLGLRTLTVVEEAVKLIERRRNRLINLKTLPLDDPDTFALLARAETMGVFQLESSGMRDLLKKIKPTQFEDIISVIALFRPGPIGSGMLDEFMKRKHGQIPIKYEHPRLEPVLKSTYGVIVFQEQVMRIASDLAGFSLAQADLLRRAMGKKNPEVMEAQRKAFVDGCKHNGIPEKTATRIFDLMEHFAGYGFNKCVTGDTEIIDAETGAPITVESLYRQPRPLSTVSIDDNLRLVTRRITHVMSNGTKPTYTIRTRLGHRITVTDNHPFLTMRGWTEAGALRTGDFIAAPRVLPGPAAAASQPMETHEIAVLAEILAEGNTCHPSGVYFYNNDPALVEDFVRHARCFALTVPRVTKRRNLYEVYAGTGGITQFRAGQTPWNKSGGSRPTAVAPRSGLRLWIEQLGLAWVKGTEKFVPEPVFQLPDHQLAQFLGRLWSGDGHIGADRTTNPLFYATSSARLAGHVQQLLLRLGIVSVVTEKRFRYRGTLRPGFVVLVTGKAMMARFLDLIGPHVIGRPERLERLRQVIGRRADDRASRDVIPADIKHFVRQAKDDIQLNWNELEHHSGVCMKEFYGAVRAGTPGFRRSTIGRIAEFLESPELLRYATSDLYWDRILAIEPAGLRPTYDLTVEGTHNFIANGLVVHNSHSAAYAMISYRTSYLKARFPVEFMTALLTSEMGNTDKLVVYLDEAKRTGLKILPPDINESQAYFTAVDDRTIRCGLGVIKNVGLSAIESVIQARDAQAGRFRTVQDLCAHIDLRLVNHKVLESLIKSGACDSMGASRAGLLASLDQAMEEATSAQKDRLSGQATLFEALTGPAAPAPPAAGSDGAPPSRPRDWPESQKLAFEKELLGFYVSGHPLGRYERAMKAFATTTTQQLLQAEPDATVTVAGMLTKIKLTTTKKTNEQMAICTLEDLHGETEVLVFPSSFTQLAPQLKPNAIVFVEARVMIREDQPRLVAQQIIPIDQGAGKLAQAMDLVLRHGEKELLEQLKGLLARFPGAVPIYLRLEMPEQAPMRLKLAEDFKCDPRQELLDELGLLLGDDAVFIKRQPAKPPQPFQPKFRARSAEY